MLSYMQRSCKPRFKPTTTQQSPGQGYDQMFGAIFPHGQVGIAAQKTGPLIG